MTTASTQTQDWRDLALIVALGLVVLVPSLFTRDPWNPDEPRYAEVAREMVVLGDYLVPHLNGEVYPDKPPLFFWATAGLMRLGLGIHAGRVVAAAAALGTLLLTYGLGRRLYGREVGLWAALVTLTTLLFAWIAKCGVLDAPLTLCVVGAVACGLRALESPGRRAGAWWLAAYAATAAGVLIKGPVAVVVPALALVPYGIVRRREVRGGGWWHLAGAGAFALVLAAWLVPARIHGGAEYFEEIVLGQTARRLLRSDSHREPPYHYLLWWPLFFLPWSLLLPLALAAAWRAARGRLEPRTWLPVLWFAVGFLFFSAVSGKRERYLLPLVPAAGLLVARYIQQVARGRVPWPRWHAGLWRATLVVGAVVAVAVSSAALSPGPFARRFGADAETLQRLEAALTPGVKAAAVATSVVLVAAVLYASRLATAGDAETRRALLAVAAALVVSMVADVAALPVIDRFKSGRGLIEESRACLDEADEVLFYWSDFSGVYNLFSGRVHIPVVEDKAALRARLASPRRVAVIGREKRLGALLDDRSVHVVVRERVGHRRMVVLTNWPAPRAHEDPATAP